MFAKLINEAEYESALSRFEALLDAPDGSPEAIERDALVEPIGWYEDVHFSIPEPTYWQALKFRLEQTFRH